MPSPIIIASAIAKPSTVQLDSTLPLPNSCTLCQITENYTARAMFAKHKKSLLLPSRRGWGIAGVVADVCKSNLNWKLWKLLAGCDVTQQNVFFCCKVCLELTWCVFCSGKRGSCEVFACVLGLQSPEG